MKTVVTGGAGFIGSHLVRRLTDEGHAVTVVDDLSTGRRNNLPSGSNVVARDLAHDPIDDVLAGVEVIFHLAAVPSVPRSIVGFRAARSCRSIPP